MELSCLKENLAFGLNSVRNIANARAVEHITQHVLLETENNNTVKLSTTNLQTSISVSIPGMIAEPGRACVSVKLLTEYVQTLPNDRIDIKGDKQNQGFVNVECEGKTARMACVDPEDFPQIPIRPDNIIATFSPQELRNNIKKVAIAAAKDESRPILGGILFSITNDTYQFAAADGFRLAVQKGVLSTPVDEDARVVIPVAALRELERIITPQFNSIQIGINPNKKQITFMSSDFVLTSQLLQGTFPDFDRIIPESHKTRSVFSIRNLTQAVKTASIFAKAGKSNIIRMETQESKAFISTQADTVGDSNCELPFQSLEGDRVRIAFNSDFLQDLLNVLSNDVILETTDSTSPAVFTQLDDEDYLHIVMPMFVQWDNVTTSPEEDETVESIEEEEEEIVESIAA